MPRSPRGDLKCTGPSLPSDILILLNGVTETVFAFAEHIQVGVKLVKRIEANRSFPFTNFQTLCLRCNVLCCLFFFFFNGCSAARNEQEEMEEKREIKRRLTRKVSPRNDLRVQTHTGSGKY